MVIGFTDGLNGAGDPAVGEQGGQFVAFRGV
jgi:hypothetical protein